MAVIDIDNIIHGLNDMQRQAVECLEGPLLIMAGAGSGKTRVLTCRIANLLAHGVPPYSILAITFTNKAASEMRERVEKMIGNGSEELWLSTFHSFCARILRREIENLPQLDYKKNFTIYDASDSLGVVKACLKEMNIDDKVLPANVVMNAISNAKNQLMGPLAYSRMVEGSDFNKKKIAELYQMYTGRLRKNNALDFDDLLMLTVTLLQENEEVRLKYQRRFRHILIDEYQDTNGAQYELTRLLADGYRNLCVVGDADQSIYGWRGADISNIMNFKRDYPEATVIKLEQNYRSTKTILEAANGVIHNNTNRIPKDLWTDNPQGEPITLYSAFNEREEAQFVTNTISRQKSMHDVSYGDMAILYRTNAQSRVIEEGLMKAGIPYTIVGGLRFYDRKEIKDMLAYLRLIYNPVDNVSLLRIINVPKRGLGDSSLQKLSAYATDNDMSIFDVISLPGEMENVAGLTKKAKNSLEAFATFIMEAINVSMLKPVSFLLNYVMENSGYIKALQEDKAEKKEENQSRIENLKEFVGVAMDFEKNEDEPTLENFLSNVALVSDIDNADMGDERVNLMTFHSAKGLEFPVVFMVGMEEGIFPSSRSMYSDFGSEMEEERRTCYVGITRAQRKLYLTHAYQRMIYGRTCNGEISRFVKEISDDLIDSGKKKSNIGSASKSFGGGFSGGFNAGSLNNNRSGFSRNNSVSDSSFIPKHISGARDNSDKGKPMSGYEAMKNILNKKSTAPVVPNPIENWKAGDKARHAKWGVGTVISVAEKNGDMELKIAFDGQGIKTLQRRYAPIEKV